MIRGRRCRGVRSRIFRSRMREGSVGGGRINQPVLSWPIIAISTTTVTVLSGCFITETARDHEIPHCMPFADRSRMRLIGDCVSTSGGTGSR